MLYKKEVKIADGKLGSRRTGTWLECHHISRKLVTD